MSTERPAAGLRHNEVLGYSQIVTEINVVLAVSSLRPFQDMLRRSYDKLLSRPQHKGSLVGELSDYLGSLSVVFIRATWTTK